ncbi:MAG: response regulator [Alphaproteobacteria bacterium]|nr:response regulator [Alphaproteobacteria bacterium]
MRDNLTLVKEKAILERKTVLLVDDQRFVRSIVRASLADIERLVVLEAEDGAEALEIMTKENVDAVVLDINMAPMNGLRALKAIRTCTNGIQAATPVVMLTSLNDMSVVRSCGELDCQGFLLKPVSKGELISKLARAVSREWTLRDAGHYWGIDVPTIIPVEDGGVAAPPKPAKRQAARQGHEVKNVTLDELKPKDVLIEDLRTENGTAMVTAGTELTGIVIDRLQDLKKMAATNNVDVEREIEYI